MEAKEGYNSQELKKPLGLCLCGGGAIGFAHIGVLNNLPAQPLEPLCRAVIGVDVFPFTPPTKMHRPIDAISYTVRGIQHVNSSEGRSMCDFLIEPTVARRYHEFRFEAYQKIFKIGYKDTIDYIKANPEILKI